MGSVALDRAFADASIPLAARESFPVEIRDVDLPALAGRGDAWERLAAGACAPNPFFTRPVIAAHLAHAITPAPRVLTAWRGTNLVAALPYRPAVRFGWTGRANAAWASPFVTSSTPLVSSDRLDDTVGLLLDGVAAAGGVWLLPQFTLDGPVGAAMLRECGRRGWPSRIIGRFERPVLDRRASYEAYAAGLGANRRKDLARRMRRLGEEGRVEFRSDTEGEGLARAVDSFLALEASGWKGRRGTALASRPETAAFARALFRSGAGPVSARADMLLLDGRPIAVSLALVSGRTAYLLKTAYDETLARFAPGLLLENEIVRALHAERFADRLDSAAGPGTPLADLYPDREAVGDLVIGCDPPGGSAGFERLVGRELARREVLRRAKAAFWEVRDRWQRLMLPAHLAAERRKT